MAEGSRLRRWVVRLAAWVYVGVPLGWGVAQVLTGSAVLFR